MKYLNYILIFFLFLSCTKEIEIIIPNNATQFVVNGYIENGEPAKILLTRSLPYFDPVNDDILDQSLINDALVVISDDNNNRDTLQYMLENTDTWISNYLGSNIIGQEESTYRLEIFKGDTVVWAVTTIPKLAPIDSLSLRFVYRADDSTYCYLFARWTDPDTIGNCIRAFSKTNDDSYFISMLEQGGNYNDEYVNGWSFSFPMYKGRGFWQDWEKDGDGWSGGGGATIGFWTVGDDVEFKWSSVDRASWDFWVSLEHNNPGGPFGTPSDAHSNINGGLGVFSGTSSEYFNLLAIPLNRD